MSFGRSQHSNSIVQGMINRSVGIFIGVGNPVFPFMVMGRINHGADIIHFLSQGSHELTNAHARIDAGGQAENVDGYFGSQRAEELMGLGQEIFQDMGHGATRIRM